MNTLDEIQERARTLRMQEETYSLSDVLVLVELLVIEVKRIEAGKTCPESARNENNSSNASIKDGVADGI